MDLTKFNPPAIVGEVVAGEAAQTRKQLEQVISSANSSMFDIGQLLYKIKKNGYYDGYSTFTEYTKSLNFKNRRLRYLTTIAEVMDEVGIERKEYEPLGIAKLREITSLNPNDEWWNPESKEPESLRSWIIKLVEDGHELTLEEIRQHVRTLKGLVGEDELVWLHLRVKKSSLDSVLRPAIDKAKMLIGSVGKDEDGNALDASDSKAIESICADFLSGE